MTPVARTVRPAAPQPLPAVAPPEQAVELATANAGRHEWIARAGRPDRAVTHGHYQRMADLEVSTTDPDATLMQTHGGAHLGYQTHYVVDGGKARVVLAALVTPAEVMENQPALDLLWRTASGGSSDPGTSPGTPSTAPWRTSPPWSGRASAPTSP